MRVPRRRAIGNNRHRLVGGMRRIIPDLDVHHRGKTAETLRADTEPVDLVVQFQAQLLGAVAGAALLQIVNIDRLQQGLLRQQHRFFRSAADTDAEHARGTPAGTHLRHHFQYPVDHRVRRIQHREFRLGLAATALGGNVNFYRIARNDLVMHDARGIVAGVLTLAIGVLQDGCPQHVVGVLIGAANALVAHVGHRHIRVPLHLHTHAQEHGNDAGILADGPAAHCAHARIDQNLCYRIARRGIFLALVSLVHGSNKIERMKIGNVLQRVGDAVD